MEPLHDVVAVRVVHHHEDQDGLVPDDAPEELLEEDGVLPADEEEAGHTSHEDQQVRHAQVGARAADPLDEERAREDDDREEDRIGDEDAGKPRTRAPMARAIFSWPPAMTPTKAASTTTAPQVASQVPMRRRPLGERRSSRARSRRSSPWVRSGLMVWSGSRSSDVGALPMPQSVKRSARQPKDRGPLDSISSLASTVSTVSNHPTSHGRAGQVRTGCTDHGAGIEERSWQRRAEARAWR